MERQHHMTAAGPVDFTDEEQADYEYRFANPPSPSPPTSVEMRQARLALLQAGHYATVNSAIAGLQGTEGDAARIEWEFAQTVRRNHSLIGAMQAVLDLTDAQVDALFVTAAGL
jgi:hypothetical protein